MIEKFKKDQDEHVVAGDAEVDARLEVNENRISLNLYTAVEFGL